VQSGQLNNGANAVTVITCPLGSGTSIAFGCDNGLQGMAPAVLPVAVYDTEWHLTQPVTVDSARGQTVIPFTDPAKTGGDLGPAAGRRRGRGRLGDFLAHPALRAL
jgi:hypothetical protein